MSSESTVPNAAVPTRRRAQLSGLDEIRVTALVLVTIQHVLTLTGHDEWTRVAGMNIGTFGVSLFLAVSGLLAATDDRPPWPWLVKRLHRLLPAYWLVTAVAFALNWLARYKPVTMWQFLAQMSGIGLFTHPRSLLNVPTWFISILLVCYLVTFVVRSTGRPLVGNLVVLAVVTTCTLLSEFPWPWFQLLPFFLAATVAGRVASTKLFRGLLVTGVGVCLLTPLLPELRVVGLSLAVIGVVTCLPRTRPLLHTLASYSYEYYLVHGICLSGMIHLLALRPGLAIAIGLVLSAVGAVLVQRLAARFVAGGVRAPRIDEHPRRASLEGSEVPAG